MMGIGIIGTALAGALSGAGEGAYAGTMEQTKEAARLKEIETMQEAELMKAKALETWRREPGIRAATAADGIINARTAAMNPVANDDEGNAMPKATVSDREQANIRAAALDKEGLTHEAHLARQDVRDMDRMVVADKQISSRDAADERRHKDAMKRLDQQFEHQKRQDSVSAGNAARMLAVSEAQVEGMKLDNAQKQQLVDLDKEWTATADPKAREEIAQRRAALTGKWNESFEVKTGNDQSGNAVVLGYIDKRRGTFTKPDGSVTDMRSGETVGGKAPYADETELKGKDGKVYVVRDGAPVLKDASAKNDPVMPPAAKEPPVAYRSLAGLRQYEPKSPRRGVAGDPDWADYQAMTDAQKLEYLRAKQSGGS